MQTALMNLARKMEMGIPAGMFVELFPIGPATDFYI
jgi:hypothetical protein